MNGISHTAWLVMISQIGLGRAPRWQALVAPEHAAFYQSCYDYCLSQSLLYRVLDRVLPIDRHLALIEKMLAYGAPQHFILRKHAIAGQVAGCIADGAEQLVVLGAGFDALALHVARDHPGVTCFEIDTPAMHTHKTNAARAHCGALPANFYGIGNDFNRHSLYEVLWQNPAFAKDKPTVFVAEGVTMYLPAAAVGRLFNDIHALCARQWLIFTAMEKQRQEMGGGWRALRALILMIKDEQFNWGLPEAHMAAFLQQHGFSQQTIQNYADLQRPHRSPQEMALISAQAGEYLVCAKRGDG